jgi:hypothetical protein
MKLIQFNWNPTERQLRQFGSICLVVLPLLGWMWGARFWLEVGLAAVGLVLAVTSWLSPKIIRPLFIGLTIITIPIGLVIGELAMILIYFGVFLPIGVLFRISGRDALQLRRRFVDSHWQPKRKPSSVASYYRQS